MHRWLSFCLAACLLLAGAVHGAPPALNLSQGERQILRDAAYLRTAERLEFTEAVQRGFGTFSRDQVNQGVSTDYHWLHFSVDNPVEQPRKWVLRGETTYLDNLVIYHRDDPQSDFAVTHLSDRAPFHSRVLDYRTLSFPHETAGGGSTEIYLLAYHDEPDSISLRFSLHSTTDFYQLMAEENLLMGAFYGAVLLMTVLALLVGVLLNRSTALNYAAFLVSTLLLWLMLNGYGYQYLWPDNVYWHNEGFHLVFLLFVCSALEFSRRFLRLKQIAPRWNLAFVLIQGVAVFAALFRLAGYYEPVLHVAFFLMSLPGLLIPIASWIAYRRGLDFALWSCAAWLFYAFGLQAAIISAYSTHLQWGMDALFFTQAGGLVECLCLMVAMAKSLVAIESDRRVAHALAHEDPLTGLGNRRQLQVAFEALASEAGKGDRACYLVMIDVDHFKAVNDNFGHDAGDSVLEQVGQLLRRVIRKGDLAVRYGGEEFALLVRTDSAATALQIAERIRKDFAAQPTSYGEQQIYHTLCCGIAEVASQRVQLSVREMMQRADAALYQAKAAGRNQSQLYDGANVSLSPASSEAHSQFSPDPEILA